MLVRQFGSVTESIDLGSNVRRTLNNVASLPIESFHRADEKRSRNFYSHLLQAFEQNVGESID